MSTRKIADELKIHKTQVLRDLDTVCPPEKAVSPEPDSFADEPPLLNDERFREKPKQTQEQAVLSLSGAASLHER